MDISFQLYSARNAASQTDVLTMLARLGYTQVEGYGGVYGDVAAYRAAVDDAGLTMPSGHFSVADLEADLGAAFEMANTLGIQHMVAPYLDASERPTDTDGYKGFAARLAALHDQITDAGFTFSWHNHDFEFEALPDGTLPMSIILEEAPNLTWEADLAWIVRGGANPSDWLAKYGDRLIGIHVKDIAPEGENTDQDGWADVGHGTMDWAALVAQTRALAPHALMIMEHDNPSDIERFAANSITSFKAF